MQSKYSSQLTFEINRPCSTNTVLNSSSDSDPTIIDESSDSSLNLSDVGHNTDSDDELNSLKDKPGPISFQFNSLPRMNRSATLPPPHRNERRSQKVVNRHMTTGMVNSNTTNRQQLLKKQVSNVGSFEKMTIPPNRFWSSMYKCNSMQDDEIKNSDQYPTGLSSFRTSTPSKYEAAAQKAFSIKDRQGSPNSFRRPLSANGDSLIIQSQIAQARASSAVQKQILAKEKVISSNISPDTSTESNVGSIRKSSKDSTRTLEEHRKLKEKLSNAENAQAQMAAVYEESLANITTRLQQETVLRERLEWENIQLQKHLNNNDKTVHTNGPMKSTLLRPNSISSLQSMSSNDSLKKKKPSWIRSSFAKLTKKKSSASTDVFPTFQSAPTTPTAMQPSISYDFSTGATNVLDMERQLQEKDRELSDIRLENLSLLHQIDQLKETVRRLSEEIQIYKNEKEMVNNNCKSIVYTSDIVVPTVEIPKQEFYVKSNGRSVEIRIEFDDKSSKLISKLIISGQTKWENLDGEIKKLFKKYLIQIDPISHLGLAPSSIRSYSLSNVERMFSDIRKPELLPYGYLVDCNEIFIQLKNADDDSVDSLAMETLIPKNVLRRYVSLLLDNCKLILSGPTATGKTYLARKLAEHICRRAKKSFSSIATFQIDQKASKELRAYLSSLAEQDESPLVLCLDNVHHVFGSLTDVLEPFSSNVPILIGTMTSTASTSLQLHQDFKWILYSTHVEPVKSLLGRFLRQKFEEERLKNDKHQDWPIVDWLPKVWQHVNTFIETFSSADRTIGPKLFLDCPLLNETAQVWFTDLWNFSLLPYIRDAVRDSLQLTPNKRLPIWSDPVQFVLETYPWNKAEAEVGLLRLRPEDVGFDGLQINEKQDDDPLSNMLKRLQEATISLNDNNS